MTLLEITCRCSIMVDDDEKEEEDYGGGENDGHDDEICMVLTEKAY